MHSKAMWPMHGKYICPDCLREYPVAWEDLPARREPVAPSKPSIAWTAKLKRLGTM
jgi:hypothetical protein